MDFTQFTNIEAVILMEEKALVNNFVKKVLSAKKYGCKYNN